MNAISAIRRRFLLCAGIAIAILALVNALVAGVATLGVIEYGFIWYCACLAVSAAAVVSSRKARTRLRVLLMYPAVSAYVYAFGVALPDPAALLQPTPAAVGFAVMFFGCPAPAIYLSVIAWANRRALAKLAQAQACPT